MQKSGLGRLFSLAMLGAGAATYFLQQQKKAARQSLQGQAVLVTGASTGIGRAITELLAASGVQVFATVRKPSDAEALRAISDLIEPVLLDVMDHQSILKAQAVIAASLQGKKLLGLVNNAGIAVGGPLAVLPIDEVRRQFEVNVFGLLDVTQTFLPLLASQGKVIQISSIAGYVTQPFVGAYSASKHALEAVSDALRRELLLIGSELDVVVVQPGNINTPIWEKADEIDLEPYRQTPYYELGGRLKKMAVAGGQQGEDPRMVAETVAGILARKHNKDRYIVSGHWPREVFMPKALPSRWMDRLLKKFLK